jgi:hypothetical protein
MTPEAQSISAPTLVGESTVEVITGMDCTYAFLVRGELSPRMRDEFYRMMPKRFRLDIALTNYWRVSAVMCDPLWAMALREKPIPADPPKGTLLQFRN